MKKENIDTRETVILDYWEIERIVAWNFNRLKGKIYNLIEASVSDEKQQKSVKDLIRGFANDEYRLCVNELRYVAEQLNLVGYDKSITFPNPAEPLENREGIFG